MDRSGVLALVAMSVALGACGAAASLEPIGTIQFAANGGASVELFDPPESDSHGAPVVWEEVRLLDDDKLAIVFATPEGACGDPSSTWVVETPAEVVVGIRAERLNCSGRGTFKAAQVQLSAELGDRTVLNELCHTGTDAPPCDGVDEVSGSRLLANDTVSYLD